jgi:hypothetical protein
MKGILAERPQVVKSAKEPIDAAGLASRCECVSVDMFESVPAGADAYSVANVIQGCNDDRAVTVLRNCCRAMQENGRVLVVETILTEPNQPDLGKLSDIEMLVFEPGGRQRSEDEYRALYEKAGLDVTRIIPTRSPWSVIEGVAV